MCGDRGVVNKVHSPLYLCLLPLHFYYKPPLRHIQSIYKPSLKRYGLYMPYIWVIPLSGEEELGIGNKELGREEAIKRGKGLL
jgi:hypothetical protein